MSSRRGPWSTGNKYGAKKVVIGEHTFDSQMEAKRYQELKLLLEVGEITNLRVHIRYALHVGDEKIGDYESDFYYLTTGSKPQVIIEDVKGCRTALYRWKKKHFEAEYGMEITEITKGKRGGNRHALRTEEREVPALGQAQAEGVGR